MVMRSRRGTAWSRPCAARLTAETARCRPFDGYAYPDHESANERRLPPHPVPLFPDPLDRLLDES